MNSPRAQDGLRVTDRLKANLHKWRRFSRNKLVLSLIEHGLRMSFTSRPLYRRSMFLQCNSPTLRMQLTETISEFLRKGVIERAPAWDQNQLISLFFPIPKKNKKLRWILSLTDLNPHLMKKSYKMESLDFIRSMLQRSEFMTSIDLVDAFYHLLVNPTFRRWMRFRALNKVYQFRALPMGLSLSPWALSRVVGEIVRRLRTQMKISHYVDDIFICAPTREECLKATMTARATFENLGFVVNLEKSVLEPTQRLVHLGFVLDSARDRIAATNKCRRSLVKEARRLLTSPSAPARKLASLLGKLNHASIAMPQLRWRKKALERDLHQSDLVDWNKMISLKDSVKDLQALSNPAYLHRINGTQLSLSFEARITIKTDASPLGWGATLSNGIHEVSAQGRWSTDEAMLSSNAKELLAVKLAYFALKAHIPRKQNVLMLTDNTTALAYLRGYGRMPHLLEIIQPMLISIWKRSIQLRASHIPGVMNEEADRLSRRFRTDHDWQISISAFQTIQATWGPMATDLFADRINSKCPQFLSWGPEIARAHVS